MNRIPGVRLQRRCSVVPDPLHPPKAAIPRNSFGVRPSLCVGSSVALWDYSRRGAGFTLKAPKLMGR